MGAKHREMYYPSDGEKELIDRLSIRLKISRSGVIAQAIWFLASGKAYQPDSVLADMMGARPKEVPIEVVGPK